MDADPASLPSVLAGLSVGPTPCLGFGLCLELVVASLRELGSPRGLADLHLHTPVLLDQPRRVKVQFGVDGASFRVTSQPTGDGDAPETLHVGGRSIPVPNVQAHAEAAPGGGQRVGQASMQDAGDYRIDQPARLVTHVLQQPGLLHATLSPDLTSVEGVLLQPLAVEALFAGALRFGATHSPGAGPQADGWRAERLELGGAAGVPASVTISGAGQGGLCAELRDARGELACRLVGLARGCDGRDTEGLRGSVEAAVRDSLPGGQLGLAHALADLGVNSLALVRIVNTVADELGLQPSMERVLCATTVGGLIDALMAAERAEPPAGPGARVAHMHEYCHRLSAGQTRLWFLHRQDPSDVSYNVHVGLVWEGELDVPRLDHALRCVVTRHEVLRTRVGMEAGTPHAVVAPPDLFRVHHETLPAESAHSLPTAERAALDRHATRPFDLARELPLRVVCVRSPAGHHLLSLTFHHIAVDGHSVSLVVDQMLESYASVTALPSTAPAPVVQYADYAAWEVEQTQQLRAAQDLAYWSEKLAGLQRPRLNPIAEAQGVRCQPFRLEGAQLAALEACARRHGCTPFVVVCAAYSLCLASHTGGGDTAFGFFSEGRTLRPLQDAVGFFVRTLVLRSRVGRPESVAAFLGAMRAEVAACLEHQSAPFDAVVRAVGTPFERGATPIFSASLVMEGSALDFRGLPSARVRPAPGGRIDGSPGQSARYDVELAVAAEDGGVRGELTLRRSCFDQAMAEGFLGTLLGAMDALCGTDDGVLRTGAWLPSHVLSTQQGPASDSVVQCSLDGLAARAHSKPDSVAQRFEGRAWTYDEVARLCAAISDELDRRGVGAGAAVAVRLWPGPYTTAAAWAVMGSGRVYVPMDPSLPQELSRWMLSDCESVAMITTRELAEGFDVDGVQSVPVDGLCPSLRLSDAGAHQMRSDDTAYVVYTSGSTARPKGVAVSHGALANHMGWMIRCFDFAASDCFVQRTTTAFDASIWELLAPWMVGARAVVASRQQRADVRLLGALLESEACTVIQGVPSLLRLCCDLRVFTKRQVLRLVFAGGEQLTTKLAQELVGGTSARVVNLYGPSECTVDTLWHELARDEVRGVVPIGRPIQNVSASVVDASGQAVPRGVLGELSLSGAALGKGYIGAAAGNPAGFVRDGDRGPLYRTGDMVRMDSAGRVTFVGRRDGQAKLRGHRLDLCAIESELERCEGVAAAVVHLDPHGGEAGRLVAVYQGPLRAAVVSGIRRQLAGRLPRYMQPVRYLAVERLPLLVSGKLDRAAVGRLVAQQTVAVVKEQPSGPVEERLANVWADVLGLGPEQIGRDSDFFLLGGDSLVAVRLASRAEGQGLALTIRMALERPTIAAQAEALATGGASPERRDLTVEARLDLPSCGGQQASVVPSRVALVTGASGFIAPFVVERLLECPTRQVVCMLRATEGVSARQRLERHVKQLGLWDASWVARVQVVAGDLAEHQLGLTDGAYDALCQQVDTVYHFAADTSLVAPYEGLRLPNVSAVREAIRFCADARARLFAASSVGVLGAVPAQGARNEGAALSEWAGLAHGYLQAKWVAEQLLMQARQHGVKCCALRLARVWGDTRTGAVNPSGLLTRVVRQAAASGCFFGPEDFVFRRVSPVDHVARSVVALSDDPGLDEPVLHLFHPDGLAAGELLRALADVGARPQLVSYPEFRAGIVAGSPLEPLKEQLPAKLVEPAYLLEADSQHTLALLSERGLAWPRYSREELARVVGRALSGGWRAAPEPTPVGR